LPGAWKENDRIRTEGSRLLVDAALDAGVGRHVQESITFPYADQGSSWIDESAALDVVPMMRSSQAAEEQARRMTEAGRVGIVLRFAMFYGPDSVHTIDAARLAERGQAPTLGRPDAYGSWIHLDDAARAAVTALDLPAGTYNVAEDDPITKGELVEIAARVAGRPKLSWTFSKVARLGGKKTEPLGRSQRVSNRKLREASPWRPEHPSIREGWPLVVRQIEQEATHA
jgi:nucleoside-diphosphate-sugar epimerase